MQELFLSPLFTSRKAYQAHRHSQAGSLRSACDAVVQIMTVIPPDTVDQGMDMLQARIDSGGEYVE
jgi:hypothetical protein